MPRGAVNGIPCSSLVVSPKSGHAIDLEEAEMFNQHVLNFLTAVDSGKWRRRGE